MATASEYFRAAEARLAFLQEQSSTLKQTDEFFERDAQRATELAARTWRELGGYLLPEVSPAHLADLEARLSYPGLMP